MKQASTIIFLVIKNGKIIKAFSDDETAKKYFPGFIIKELEVYLEY
jgi:hypothetical protein